MKKLSFLLLCTLAVCLYSCSGKPSASSIMAHLITDLDDMPGSRLVYYSDASPDTANFLDAEHAEKIFYDTFDINALCSEYAIMLSSDDFPYEIDILRARSYSDTTQIISALYARKDLIQQRKSREYDIVGNEKAAQSAKVYSKGNYVFLLVTTDNDTAQRVIEGMI